MITTQRYRMMRVNFPFKYGMSGSPQAYRPHLLDSELSHVKVWKSGQVEYNIQWVCSRPSRKYKVQFLKKLPVGLALCKACQDGLAHREYLASQGITVETLYRQRMADQNRLRAIMRGAPFAYARKPQSHQAPF